jgi:membrane protein implicated in regulation of membrane protease activity
MVRLVPWMPRHSAAVTAGAALLLSSTAILYAHYIRRVHGGSPSLEEVAAAAQHSSLYAMGGTAVAVLAAVCGFAALYRLSEGDLLVGVLSVAASAGFAGLAGWIIRRGLPRQESGTRPLRTVEETASTARRLMRYTMPSCAAALLASASAFVALYRVYEGDLPGGVLSAAAGAGLAVLSLWLLKRRLRRYERDQAI